MDPLSAGGFSAVGLFMESFGGLARLRSPIAQVEEIVPHRAVAELGDRGKNPFELVAADGFDHALDERLFKAGPDAFLGGIPLVDQEVQQLVGFGVGEP